MNDCDKSDNVAKSGNDGHNITASLFMSTKMFNLVAISTDYCVTCATILWNGVCLFNSEFPKSCSAVQKVTDY
jgi:hypothetical protein